jgi:uncharacterized membrane protein
MENLDLLILTIAIVLIFISVVKIHLSFNSRDSFLMFLAAILILVIGAIYIGTWMLVTFYYGPDNSPVILSYILSGTEIINDLIFLMGAIGFFGFTKKVTQKAAN